MSADGTSSGWMVEIYRLDSIPEGMSANTVQPNFHCARLNGILEVLRVFHHCGHQTVIDTSHFSKTLTSCERSRRLIGSM